MSFRREIKEDMSNSKGMARHKAGWQRELESLVGLLQCAANIVHSDYRFV